MKKRKIGERLEAIGRRVDALAAALANLAAAQVETSDASGDGVRFERGVEEGKRLEADRWARIGGVASPESVRKIVDGFKAKDDGLRKATEASAGFRKRAEEAEAERDRAEAERKRQVEARMRAEKAYEELSRKVAEAYDERDAARKSLQKEVPELKSANESQKRTIDSLRQDLAALRAGGERAADRARLEASDASAKVSALRDALATARAFIGLYADPNDVEEATRANRVLAETSDEAVDKRAAFVRGRTGGAFRFGAAAQATGAFPSSATDVVDAAPPEALPSLEGEAKK